jgi:uncharacterized protein
MPSFAELQPRVIALLGDFYSAKDTMHDLSHIERIRARALEFAESRPCDLDVLQLAAYFHGFVSGREEEVRDALSRWGVSPDGVEQVMTVAKESSKRADPASPEGQLLHDAHLLEGDDNWLITKGLVTGTARGQTLTETVSFLQKHWRESKARCCFPENQRPYEERVARAIAYMDNLAAELTIGREYAHNFDAHRTASPSISL